MTAISGAREFSEAKRSRMSTEKSQIEKVCDVDSSHNLGAKGLVSDPFGRKIQRSDGTEAVMKLCQACYKRAIAERQTHLGWKCDLDPTHKLGTNGLKRHPSGRTIQSSDGTEAVMKLCNACYKRAMAEHQTHLGMKCDLDPTHKLGVSALVSDPFGRKIQRSDGTEAVMKLCQACYKRATAEHQTHLGMKCDLDPTHKLGVNGLRRHPFGRKIERSDGTEAVMKLCSVCYDSARRTKKFQNPTINQEQSVTVEDLSLAEDIAAKESEVKHLAAEALLALVEGHQEPAAALAVSVKLEPFEEDDAECHLEAVHHHNRIISNRLPILQDPQDHERSLLLEVEGPIERIRCANWASLADISYQQKQSITDQVHRWLHLNEHDISAYEAELNNIFEITIPVDEGPLRGVSTFAKKDLAPFTVIAPYAGVLHKNEESLDRAIRSQGSYNTLSYLFATRSSKRAIDGFSSGNVATLTNTSQLEGKPAWKKNNTVPLLFGKNLVFYVSTEVIARGEEILVDYGPIYNPLEFVKKEPEDV